MYSKIGAREPRCRINSSKEISRRQCRNNCKQWNRKEGKCKLNIPTSD